MCGEDDYQPKKKLYSKTALFYKKYKDILETYESNPNAMSSQEKVKLVESIRSDIKALSQFTLDGHSFDEVISNIDLTSQCAFLSFPENYEYVALGENEKIEIKKKPAFIRPRRVVKKPDPVPEPEVVVEEPSVEPDKPEKEQNSSVEPVNIEDQREILIAFGLLGQDQEYSEEIVNKNLAIQQKKAAKAINPDLEDEEEKESAAQQFLSILQKYKEQIAAREKAETEAKERLAALRLRKNSEPKPFDPFEPTLHEEVWERNDFGTKDLEDALVQDYTSPVQEESEVNLLASSDNQEANVSLENNGTEPKLETPKLKGVKSPNQEIGSLVVDDTRGNVESGTFLKSGVTELSDPLPQLSPDEQQQREIALALGLIGENESLDSLVIPPAISDKPVLTPEQELLATINLGKPKAIKFKYGKAEQTCDKCEQCHAYKEQKCRSRELQEYKSVVVKDFDDVSYDLKIIYPIFRCPRSVRKGKLEHANGALDCRPVDIVITPFSKMTFRFLAAVFLYMEQNPSESMLKMSRFWHLDHHLVVELRCLFKAGRFLAREGKNVPKK